MRDDDASTHVESALVLRVRHGDAAAFELLFRHHYDGMYRFAYSYVGRRDWAEELVQDVFAKIWERRSDWVVAGTVQSYLFSAVRNGAVSLARHERIVRDHEARTITVNADEPARAEAANETVERAEVDTAVRRAVERLPERTRRVFELHRQQQLSYAEIAAVMEISLKGVEYHMGMALKALRDDLLKFRR